MSSEDLNMQQTVSQSANQEKQKQSSSAHANIANANATTTIDAYGGTAALRNIMRMKWRKFWYQYIQLNSIER